VNDKVKIKYPDAPDVIKEISGLPTSITPRFICFIQSLKAYFNSSTLFYWSTLFHLNISWFQEGHLTVRSIANMKCHNNPNMLSVSKFWACKLKRNMPLNTASTYFTVINLKPIWRDKNAEYTFLPKCFSGFIYRGHHSNFFQSQFCFSLSRLHSLERNCIGQHPATFNLQQPWSNCSLWGCTQPTNKFQATRRFVQNSQRNWLSTRSGRSILHWTTFYKLAN